MNKTLFDDFYNEYKTVHSRDETIAMLEAHKAYLNYSKYNYTNKTFKQYEDKIKHINELERSLK